MTHAGSKAIECARTRLLNWAEAKKIPINRVEIVASFQDWDDGIGVWVFYEHDADVTERNENGSSNEIESKLLGYLDDCEYPYGKFPNVVFVFDSHENVQKNFGGNYFYRLR